ncbi:hypothetical protein AALP_AA3G147800 [Arabis alpina]|uniref:Uncharacterized protein n=1 Tax=Arabis alpina TaxID=50452 RepID=A0A087H991_ARAAL|nr:hypothetical protein AALP_AA3G147800 [Arabis alpina]
MTNYGTIPTSSHPSPAIDLEYISRAKDRIKSATVLVMIHTVVRRSDNLFLDEETAAGLTSHPSS